MSTDRSDDPFDVFDPWTHEPDPSEAPTAAEPVTAASPAAPVRRRRRRIRDRVSPPLADRHPARPMKNPAAFLRNEALTTIEAMGRRLEAAGHRSTLQDLLDLPTPALRFLLWPHPGPLADGADRTLVTLELALGEVEPDVLAARFWVGPRPAAERIEHLGTVTTAQLTPGWIEMQALAFVEKALRRA